MKRAEIDYEGTAGFELTELPELPGTRMQVG